MLVPEQVIAEALGGHVGDATCPVWMHDAPRVLAALHDAGFAVVPREPSEAMVEAASREFEPGTWAAE